MADIIPSFGDWGGAIRDVRNALPETYADPVAEVRRREEEKKRAEATAQAQRASLRQLPLPYPTPTAKDLLPASNIEEGQLSPQDGGYKAVRQANGTMLFTNQAVPGALEGAEARAAAQSVEPLGKEIVSPYDRDIYGRPTSSATTRPGSSGGYMPSQTDWSKVANPMAFEGFRETPVGNILAQREAELAKAEQERAQAEIETSDPYARERVKGEAAAEVARAPYEAQRENDVADEKELISLQEEILLELMKEPEFRNAPPQAKQAALRVAMMKHPRYQAFRDARAKYTMRGDVY